VAVLRPGDRVLLTIAAVDLDVETAARLRGRLVERFPGVEFTFATGVTGLAVQPGGVSAEQGSLFNVC